MLIVLVAIIYLILIIIAYIYSIAFVCYKLGFKKSYNRTLKKTIISLLNEKEPIEKLTLKHNLTLLFILVSISSIIIFIINLIIIIIELCKNKIFVATVKYVFSKAVIFISQIINFKFTEITVTIPSFTHFAIVIISLILCLNLVIAFRQLKRNINDKNRIFTIFLQFLIILGIIILIFISSISTLIFTKPYTDYFFLINKY